MPHPEFDEGSYWGEFVEMRDDKSPKGTAYIAVRFRLLNYWHNEKWEEAIPIDKQRDVRLFVTEAAEPYTIKTLERLGWNGDFDHPTFSTFENGCTVLTCEIKDDYENWAFPAPEREQTAWEVQDRRRFAAKFKQQAVRDTVPPKSTAPSAPPPAPAKAAPQPPTDNSPVRDDEVPGGLSDEVLDVPDDEIPF